MADQRTIREAAERSVRILTLKSGKGHLTGTTTARLEDGLRCVVEDGPWKLAVDMPVKVGGEESAPTPGALGRGALASCIAISIAAWAARREVPLNGVEVEVQADFDARGELGMDDSIPAGYKEVRYTVSIDSPAPADIIAGLVDAADRYSPYVDVFARAQTMRRTVRLNGEEV
ncbi:MAG: OsmC family protein [Gammaproteobacteria bacterium]|nr:OsmC family protein [Gammaproteobacteria bacterium]